MSFRTSNFLSSAGPPSASGFSMSPGDEDQLDMLHRRFVIMQSHNVVKNPAGAPPAAPIDSSGSGTTRGGSQHRQHQHDHIYDAYDHQAASSYYPHPASAPSPAGQRDTVSYPASAPSPAPPLSPRRYGAGEDDARHNRTGATPANRSFEHYFCGSGALPDAAPPRRPSGDLFSTPQHDQYSPVHLELPQTNEVDSPPPSLYNVSSQIMSSKCLSGVGPPPPPLEVDLREHRRPARNNVSGAGPSPVSGGARSAATTPVVDRYEGTPAAEISETPISPPLEFPRRSGPEAEAVEFSHQSSISSVEGSISDRMSSDDAGCGLLDRRGAGVDAGGFLQEPWHTYGRTASSVFSSSGGMGWSSDHPIPPEEEKASDEINQRRTKPPNHGAGGPRGGERGDHEQVPPFLLPPSDGARTIDVSKGRSTDQSQWGESGRGFRSFAQEKPPGSSSNVGSRFQHPSPPGSSNIGKPQRFRGDLGAGVFGSSGVGSNIGREAVDDGRIYRNDHVDSAVVHDREYHHARHDRGEQGSSVGPHERQIMVRTTEGETSSGQEDNSKSKRAETRCVERGAPSNATRSLGRDSSWGRSSTTRDDVEKMMPGAPPRTITCQRLRGSSSRGDSSSLHISSGLLPSLGHIEQLIDGIFASSPGADFFANPSESFCRAAPRPTPGPPTPSEDLSSEDSIQEIIASPGARQGQSQQVDQSLRLPAAAPDIPLPLPPLEGLSKISRVPSLDNNSQDIGGLFSEDATLGENAPLLNRYGERRGVGESNFTEFVDV